MTDLTNTVAAFLLTYAMHSTVLLIGALVITRRLRTTAARELVLKAAIVGALVTTTAHAMNMSGDLKIAARAPVRAAVVQPERAAMEPARAAESVVHPSAITTTVQASTEDVTPAASAPARPSWLSAFDNTPWTTLLVAVWLSGALLMLARHAYRFVRMRRHLGDRQPLVDASLSELLLDLQQTMRNASHVTLTTSTRITSPLAIGSSEICIPRDLPARLTREQQRSMIAHELAHLVRRDTLWLRVFAFIEAVFFIQPLNRAVRRRIQNCSEQLCDEWAVTLTHQPLALAQCLAEVARSVQARPLAYPYPAMIERSSSLVERVQRVLRDTREPLHTTRVVRLAAVGGLMALALVLPGFAMQGTASAIPILPMQTPDIASAVKAIKNGTLRFSFPTREGVCGTGVEKDGTRTFALQPVGDWLPTGRRDMTALYVWDRGRLMRNDVSTTGSKWTTECLPGPARIDMRIANGEVAGLDITVADPAPPLPNGARDLGTVDARVAAAFLGELTNEGNGVASDRAHVAWMMTPSYVRGMSLQTPMVPPAPHAPAEPPTPPHVVSTSRLQDPPPPPSRPRAPHAVAPPTPHAPTLKTPHAPPPPPHAMPFDEGHRKSTPAAPSLSMTPPAPHAPGAPPTPAAAMAPPVVMKSLTGVTPAAPSMEVMPPAAPAPLTTMMPPAPMAPPAVTIPPTPPTPPAIPRELVPLTDISLALQERVTALGNARERNEVNRVLAVYKNIPDRAMRVETIKWLAAHENVAVRTHLMRVVNTARVLEEQQAALQALSKSSDANARAFAKEYMEKHPASRIDR